MAGFALLFGRGELDCIRTAEVRNLTLTPSRDDLPTIIFAMVDHAPPQLAHVRSDHQQERVLDAEVNSLGAPGGKLNWKAADATDAGAISEDREWVLGVRSDC